MNTDRAWIELDWNQFQPWRIMAVKHHVQTHPLLQWDPLLGLGKRLESISQLLQLDQDATADTRFVTKETSVETIRRIVESRGWVHLRFVQQDPEYRRLVDTVLDSIQPEIEQRDPGMYHRAGFIFISSRHMVTPFHIDSEQNFILQLRGHKTLFVWDHDDREVVSELARDRFHHVRERDLVRWRDTFRERAHVFHLEPGVGAYMPVTSPHMVEAGDDLSVTMSFTYYTNSTRRDARLHQVHDMARSIGIKPPAVGAYPVMDGVVGTVVDGLLAARRWERRLIHRQPAVGKPPYAGTLM